MGSSNLKPGSARRKDSGQGRAGGVRANSRRSRSRDGFAEVLEGVELYRTPGRMPYAGVELDGRTVYVPIRDGAFADLLRIRYLDATGEAPEERELTRRLNTLAALAKHRGAEAGLHVRFGTTSAGEVYVDRGALDGSFVRITPDGWEVVGESPIHFWRPESMLELPRPVEGSLDAIRTFLHLRTEDDHKLMQGYAVSSFLTRPPHFVLILQGPQGSGKSVGARVLSRLIHPSEVETRHRPRNADDLLIAARRAPLLIHDNLSTVEKWESDVYCGLATGTGLSKRRLYTALEEEAFSVSGRVILTGISDLAQRDDLRERAIILDLPKIRPEKLMDEHEFWEEFATTRPEILGGLYSAVSGALRRHDIKTSWLPRMTTPARWVTAAEEALGWEHETFIRAYRRNCIESIETVIEYDAIAPYLRELARNAGTWVGTSTELLRTLRKLRNGEDRDPAWPRSPAELGRMLPRIAPALEEVGVEIRKRRESGGDRTRLIEISGDRFTSLSRAMDQLKARRRKVSGRPESARSPVGSPSGVGSMIRRFFGMERSQQA